MDFRALLIRLSMNVIAPVEERSVWMSVRMRWCNVTV